MTSEYATLLPPLEQGQLSLSEQAALRSHYVTQLTCPTYQLELAFGEPLEWNGIDFANVRRFSRCQIQDGDTLGSMMGRGLSSRTRNMFVRAWMSVDLDARRRNLPPRMEVTAVHYEVLFYFTHRFQGTELILAMVRELRARQLPARENPAGLDAVVFPSDRAPTVVDVRAIVKLVGIVPSGKLHFAVDHEAGDQ